MESQEELREYIIERLDVFQASVQADVQTLGEKLDVIMAKLFAKKSNDADTS